MYYWIPIAILFLVAILSDTSTWSPFQSSQVSEICQHMTKAERRTVRMRAAKWGAIMGIVPGVVGLFLGVLFFKSATAAVTGCALVFPAVAILLRKKWLPNAVESQQQFLASTEWARSQGIMAEEIRMYRWQK